MLSIYSRKTLLPSGWADGVRLQIEGGRITKIEPGVEAQPTDTRIDCLIPGLSNSHSHAFQRALAGFTEQRSPKGKDSFWTWRERMYELAAAMDAGRLQAIARQAYTEMLTSGYTSVAEFHYLHREPGAAARDTMFAAIRQAAEKSGIRMTYVPVLYERAGFDRPEPEGAQTLFALDIDRFLEHHERVTAFAGDRLQIAIGAHSIRAVSADSLQKIVAVANAKSSPMHIHIAEQQKEVEDSLLHYRRRPVAWLLENFEVDESWCMVHATHMDNDEIARLAQSGAVVSLCPSTEANLGDGLFPLREYLGAGGRIAIGSDSQITINPFEELRWLEYGQRLVTQTRNIVSLADSHVGSELFDRSLEGGALACGHANSGIVPGAYADLVCLDGEDPMLVAHDDRSRIDALVFSGYRLPVDRVMVHGEWCVIDGEHVSARTSRSDYAAAVTGVLAGGWD